MSSAGLGRPEERIDPTVDIDEKAEAREAKTRAALTQSVLADAAKFQRAGAPEAVADGEQAFVLAGQELIKALLAGGVQFGLLHIPEDAAIVRTEVEIARNGIYVKVFTGRRPNGSA